MIKIEKSAAVHLKTYHIIHRAIEEGVDYGYCRAYKYTSEPTESHLKQAIQDAIMIALDEIIDFD